MILEAILLIIGIAAITTGAALLSAPAAFIVGGLCVVAIALFAPLPGESGETKKRRGM